MILRVVLALLLWSSVVAAEQSQGRSISGTVVTTDRAQSVIPVRRALVVLDGQAIKGTRSMLTDDAGRFEFRELPTGRFTLSASKPAFVNFARRLGRTWHAYRADGGR
jgi:hypothetical protein